MTLSVLGGGFVTATLYSITWPFTVGLVPQFVAVVPQFVAVVPQFVAVVPQFVAVSPIHPLESMACEAPKQKHET